MKANTLLNIYQSYSLAKISALNKENLIALYAQNEQLSNLNKELVKANSVNEQILKNQIKKIERQERCRYYKNLSFNLSQAVDMIENEENTNFRIFTSNMFLPLIQEFAKESMKELEEIADKEYANNIVQKCISLSRKNQAHASDFQISLWSQLLPLQEKIKKLSMVDIANKEKEVQQVLNEKEKKQKDVEFESKSYKGCFITMCIITAFFLLVNIGTIITKDYEAMQGGIIVLVISVCLLAFSFYAKKRNAEGLQNNKDVDSQKRIDVLDDELYSLRKKERELSSKYNEILQEVTLDCPQWEKRLTEIANHLPQNRKIK